MKTKRPSVLIVIFFCAVIVCLLLAGVEIDLEHDILLMVLNTLFTGLMPIAVAVLSARAYLKNSMVNALLVCCGMLAFGLGSITAGLLKLVPDSANTIVTVYNTCALISGSLHLFAAIQGENMSPPLKYHKRIRLTLGLSAGAVSIAVALIMYGAWAGWMPRFVDAGGFTNTRNAVLWLAIAFFFASALFYSKLFRKRQRDAHYWYSLSLLMISIGLFGVCVATGIGTLLGWTGRIAQYIGASFALLSVIGVYRREKDRRSSLTETMAEFFSDAEGGYRRLTDASPDSILTIDQNLRIFIANRSAMEMFKLEADSIINTSLLELLEQPHKDEVSADLNHYAATGHSALIGHTKQMAARDSQGRVFPVEISFAGRRSQSKYNVSLIIRDISERERSKIIEKIKKSLEEAQRIAQIGSWEWHIESDRVYWSDEMFRIIGLDPKTTTARRDLYYEHIVPEDKDRVAEAVVWSVKTGEPLDMEFRIVSADGRSKTIQSVARAECGPDGRAVLLAGTMQDVTERKQAEYAARRHLKFERTVLHLAQNFINLPIEKISDAVINAIKLVGEYAGADRVTIFRFGWDDGRAHRLYEWDSIPAHYSGDKLAAIPLEKLEKVICHLKTGQPYLYDKDNEPRSKMSEVTRETGCITGIVFPLMASGKLFGSIGLSYCSEKGCKDIDQHVFRIFSEMISNVVQRLETEKSLREVSECNRLILESTLDGIAMFDPSGHVLSVNVALVKRLRLVTNIVGNHVNHILPAELFGDMGEMVCQSLSKVCETQMPLLTEDEISGYYYWNRYYPVFSQGRVTAVTLISTDITDRRKAEDAARRHKELQIETEILRKKEKEYLEILDGSTEASWIYDFERKTLVYSQEWKKRIGGEDVSDEDMNLYAMKLLHPDDLEKVTRERKAMYGSKQSKYKSEYRFRINAGGEYIWVCDQGKIVYDENGNPVKIYGTSTDITERKKAEEALRVSEGKALLLVEELKQADKNKNEFLSVLSHELRNPLASIVLGLSIMEMSDKEEQKIKTVETIKRQVDQMCHLVDELLHLTRISHNRIAIRKEIMELRSLAELIFQDFRAGFEEKGVTLRKNLANHDMLIDADSVRVKQAIGNLLYNALKFTSAGGEVVLSVHQQENSAVISVKDNGIGIRTAFLPKVFEPFSQADESLDRMNGGLGLGLSIVKGIAELHGGHTSAYSEGPGQGSEFTISFPLAFQNKGDKAS